MIGKQNADQRVESLESDKTTQYGYQIWCPYCSPNLSKSHTIINSLGVGCECGWVYLEVYENEIYISFWYADHLIGIEIHFDNFFFTTRINSSNKVININYPITFEDLKSILLFL